MQQSLRTRDMDVLVATYAPKGMRQRLRRRTRHISLATGSLCAVAIGALLAVSDVAILDSVRDFYTLDARRPLPGGSELAVRIGELERQIADVQTQKRHLETQQAEFAEKSALLETMLQASGSEQLALEQSLQQGSDLDQEIAAIAAQRKALEARWAQFEAQGELLAMEIIAVNAQRKELEAQRRQIERQQQQLAEMLQLANGIYSRNAKSSDALSSATDDSSFTYTNNSLLVDNSELDNLRGGFSIGEGMDVSFGFVQTGSIDGVEQFRNSFSIDSVAAGFANVDMSNMNSVLLQNGPGNFVSESVLDSLSNSFGSIIQNTLDDQVISTTSIFDISLHNMPGTLQGLAGEQALLDSLGSLVQ